MLSTYRPVKHLPHTEMDFAQGFRKKQWTWDSADPLQITSDFTTV